VPLDVFRGGAVEGERDGRTEHCASVEQRHAVDLRERAA